MYAAWRCCRSAAGPADAADVHPTHLETCGMRPAVAASAERGSGMGSETEQQTHGKP